MGNRYLITGAQLGMLQAFAKSNLNQFELLCMEIEDKQFVGRTDEVILDDVDRVEQELKKQIKEGDDKNDTENKIN